ncbi:MAG: CBS domain-containing protein [Alphaproteobacteria bacterium]|nr:CBS domain-containing protein [Alphaproteobacteria bacterium]
MKTAGDVMTRDVLSVTPDSSIADAVEIILENRITALPVVDEKGRLQGIIGEHDLLRATEAKRESHDAWWPALLAASTELLGQGKEKVEDVMSRDILLASEEDSLQKLVAMLSNRQTKSLPIVRNGKLVGIVSRIDILRYLARERTML